MKNNYVEQAKIRTLPCFLPWSDVFAAKEQHVGGKAWNLSRLQHYGFNVPKGGVVPVGVYEQFVIENRLREYIAELADKITLENFKQEASLLAALRSDIFKGEFNSDLVDELNRQTQMLGLNGTAVAVRSSATSEDSASASFAGIHETHLNILGFDKIVQCIKACYASIWTQQAVAYRRKMGIADQAVLPAVIIMEMVDADVAGVAFSCDPVSGRQDIYLVNANYGLGESVVDGVTEPDSYYIDKYHFGTQRAILGTKRLRTVSLPEGGTETVESNAYNNYALNKNQQFHLGLIIQRVFDTLGQSVQHQDIEWAIKDDQLCVLQARPATALPNYTDDAIHGLEEIWSNANFRDAIPMVQPLFQRYSIEHSVNSILLAPFSEIGYHLPEGLSFLKYIQGRAYIASSLYQWLYYDAIGADPADINMLMGGHQSTISVPSRSAYSGKSGLKRLARLIKNLKQATRHYKNKQKLYDMVTQHANEIYQCDLSTLSSDALYAKIMASHEISDRYGKSYMGLCSGTSYLIIAIKMMKKYFPGEEISMVNALSMGQGRITSADHGYRLLAMAEIANNDPKAKMFLGQASFSADEWLELPDSSPFKKAFAKFLSEFGHRAVYEVDMTSPRWSEDPSYLLKNIAGSMQHADLHCHQERQKQLNGETQDKLKTKMGFIARKILLNLIQKGIQGSETREQAKSMFVHFTCIGRKFFLEAGRRFVDKGILSDKNDIFHCGPAEIFSILLGSYQGEGLKQLVNERKLQHAELTKKSVPDLVVNDRYEYKRAPAIKNGNTYQGMAVSTGIAEGVAKLILNPEQGNALQPGDVLVAPSTDPAWTPLFLNACAIVLETGGYTSHGSIVAREYGIPAVVNIAGIMSILHNNDDVTVNGNSGQVNVRR